MKRRNGTTNKGVDKMWKRKEEIPSRSDDYPTVMLSKVHGNMDIFLSYRDGEWCVANIPISIFGNELIAWFDYPSYNEIVKLESKEIEELFAVFLPFIKKDITAKAWNRLRELFFELETFYKKENDKTWKSIEDAPKDGTHILVCGPHHRMEEVWWVENVFGEYFWGAKEWHYPEWDYPTHWMPLPEKPEFF